MGHSPAIYPQYAEPESRKVKGTWFRERHCDNTPLAGQRQIQMELNLTPVSERVGVGGGGSVIVWGDISFGAQAELVFVDGGTLNAHRYIVEVLADNVIPFAGEYFILMHDNAHPYVARCMTRYLRDIGIPTLDWSACSSDLNRIEHL
ncbi:hypothetical protein ANN_00648 [Periplaneta americana]|uniref:Tc1-like transposase DDE domain-containing protein n=1 Tax=Periplaneta americana TaxID=6978 RepID=A0ABQ8TTS9_PERAM|nr:hypothetical protein ANN_00648 [Periplaneta americana]